MRNEEDRYISGTDSNRRNERRGYDGRYGDERQKSAYSDRRYSKDDRNNIGIERELEFRRKSYLNPLWTENKYREHSDESTSVSSSSASVQSQKKHSKRTMSKSKSSSKNKEKKGQDKIISKSNSLEDKRSKMQSKRSRKINMGSSNEKVSESSSEDSETFGPNLNELPSNANSSAPATNNTKDKGKPAAAVGSAAYGQALRPGEGQAIAAFVQKNMRVPRRGEIGWDGKDIEELENLGYVMSGSRHSKMNAVRLRKENQVITAEEKKTLALEKIEEKKQKEEKLIGQFKDMLEKRRENKKRKH